MVERLGMDLGRVRPDDADLLEERSMEIPIALNNSQY